MHLPMAGVDMMWWQLILIGITVGVIGGFFGVGGAFMVTPALNVFGFPMAYAIGTDMAQIAGKSIVATIKHRKLGNVDARLGLIMVIFTAIGIEVGANLILWLEKIGKVGPIVRGVYIVLLFGIGFYMLKEYLDYSKREKAGEIINDGAKSKLSLIMHKINLPPMINLKKSGIRISLWVVGGVAVFTGFLAGFLGVGGGFIRMPSLIYVIGCPTTIAVGTDLFEVMISGAYGAFTYAMKGKVEIIAAVVMLCGAAVGAQFGTVATQYVKGLKIRLYFAITMLLSGVSVIFKQISSMYKDNYEMLLKPWIKIQTGLTSKEAIADWIMNNKAAIKIWIANQPESIQTSYGMAKYWNNMAGYLMLGSACALSLVIIYLMFKGIANEKKSLSAARIIHNA
ncbi:MAG: sulfite exporter TauE/SafE family protein [Nitrospirae bacterium]|nr:sulfite exporter TauE/SafE family protein [Nitrospirota bacterium]